MHERILTKPKPGTMINGALPLSGTKRWTPSHGVLDNWGAIPRGLEGQQKARYVQCLAGQAIAQSVRIVIQQAVQYLFKDSTHMEQQGRKHPVVGTGAILLRNSHLESMRHMPYQSLCTSETQQGTFFVAHGTIPGTILGCRAQNT